MKINVRNLFVLKLQILFLLVACKSGSSSGPAGKQTLKPSEIPQNESPAKPAASSSLPSEADAKETSRPILNSAPALSASSANQDLIEVANAVSCDFSSGRPQLQAQELYELERFNESHPLFKRANTDRDGYVDLVISRYSKHSPLRAGRIRREVSRILTNARMDNGLESLSLDQSWIPTGCSLVNVILRDKNGGYVFNQNIWDQLSALDQAALILNAGSRKEAESAGALSALATRRFIRGIFIESELTYKAAMAASLHLGEKVVLEYPYAEGDIVLYKKNQLDKLNPFSISACGYVLKEANKAQDSCDKEDRPTFQIGADTRRIVRIINFKVTLPGSVTSEFLVSPALIGLPLGVVDYAFSGWFSMLVGSANRIEMDKPNQLVVEFDSEAKFNTDAAKVTCRARSAVLLELPAENARSYKVDFAKARLVKCMLVGNPEFNFSSGSVQVPSTMDRGNRFYSQSFRSEETPAQFFVKETTKINAAEMPIMLIPGDEIETLRSETIVSLKSSDSARSPLSFEGCPLDPFQLKVAESSTILSALLKRSCVFRLNSARITANEGHRLEIDLRSMKLKSVTESAGLLSKPMTLELMGKTILAKSLGVNTDGTVADFYFNLHDNPALTFSLYVNSEGKSRKWPSNEDAVKGYLSVCVNHSLNRFEDYSSRYCSKP